MSVQGTQRSHDTKSLEAKGCLKPPIRLLRTCIMAPLLFFAPVYVLPLSMKREIIEGD